MGTKRKNDKVWLEDQETICLGEREIGWRSVKKSSLWDLGNSMIETAALCIQCPPGNTGNIYVKGKGKSERSYCAKEVVREPQFGYLLVC